MNIEHTPEVIHFDEFNVTVPAEVCVACSDTEKGVWVPASFCPEAKKIMEES